MCQMYIHLVVDVHYGLIGDCKQNFVQYLVTSNSDHFGFFPAFHLSQCPAPVRLHTLCLTQRERHDTIRTCRPLFFVIFF